MSAPKLIRDRIPAIIRARGGDPITYVAEIAEYVERLFDKLGEETEELRASVAADDGTAPDELADVLEVVCALAAHLGIPWADLEKIRQRKAEERGGFADRIVWVGNR